MPLSRCKMAASHASNSVSWRPMGTRIANQIRSMKPDQNIRSAARRPTKLIRVGVLAPLRSLVHEVSTGAEDGRKNVGIPPCKVGRGIRTRWREFGEAQTGPVIGQVATNAEKYQVAQ